MRFHSVYLTDTPIAANLRELLAFESSGGGGSESKQPGRKAGREGSRLAGKREAAANHSRESE